MKLIGILIGSIIAQTTTSLPTTVPTTVADDIIIESFDNCCHTWSVNGRIKSEKKKWSCKLSKRRTFTYNGPIPVHWIYECRNDDGEDTGPVF